MVAINPLLLLSVTINVKLQESKPRPLATYGVVGSSMNLSYASNQNVNQLIAFFWVLFNILYLHTCGQIHSKILFTHSSTKVFLTTKRFVHVSSILLVQEALCSIIYMTSKCPSERCQWLRWTRPQEHLYGEILQTVCQLLCSNYAVILHF